MAKKVEAAPKATAKTAPVKEDASKTYHIAKRPDGRWQVKFAKGERALKLFKTQAEAIEYAKGVAGNQGGSIRVHSVKGKIRKE